MGPWRQEAADVVGARRPSSRVEVARLFNEQSYLHDAGALAAEEKAELEREWKVEFERAQTPDFTLNDGGGEILVGDCARVAHYRWADIPDKLVKRWTAARRRRERQSAAPLEEAVAVK